MKKGSLLLIILVLLVSLSACGGDNKRELALKDFSKTDIEITENDFTQLRKPGSEILKNNYLNILTIKNGVFYGYGYNMANIGAVMDKAYYTFDFKDLLTEDISKGQELDLSLSISNDKDNLLYYTDTTTNPYILNKFNILTGDFEEYIDLNPVPFDQTIILPLYINEEYFYFLNTANADIIKYNIETGEDETITPEFMKGDDFYSVIHDENNISKKFIMEKIDDVQNMYLFDLETGAIEKIYEDDDYFLSASSNRYATLNKEDFSNIMVYDYEEEKIIHEIDIPNYYVEKIANDRYLILNELIDNDITGKLMVLDLEDKNYTELNYGHLFDITGKFNFLNDETHLYIQAIGDMDEATGVFEKDNFYRIDKNIFQGEDFIDKSDDEDIEYNKDEDIEENDTTKLVFDTFELDKVKLDSVDFTQLLNPGSEILYKDYLNILSVNKGIFHGYGYGKPEDGTRKSAIFNFNFEGQYDEDIFEEELINTTGYLIDEENKAYYSIDGIYNPLVLRKLDLTTNSISDYVEITKISEEDNYYSPIYIDDEFFYYSNINNSVIMKYNLASKTAEDYTPEFMKNGNLFDIQANNKNKNIIFLREFSEDNTVNNMHMLNLETGESKLISEDKEIFLKAQSKEYSIFEDGSLSNVYIFNSTTKEFEEILNVDGYLVKLLAKGRYLVLVEMENGSPTGLANILDLKDKTASELDLTNILESNDSLVFLNDDEHIYLQRMSTPDAFYRIDAIKLD